MNSWPEMTKNNSIPVQLGGLLHIKQVAAGTLSCHKRSLFACLLVRRQAKPWRDCCQQWDSDLLMVPVPASNLGLGDIQAKELHSQLLLWSKVIPLWQPEGTCALRSAI